MTTVTPLDLMSDEQRKARNELRDALFGEDDLGIVIRSHVIIEQELWRFVKQSVTRPNYLSGSYLPFERLLDFAMALGIDKELEAPLKRLASIRNSFAHDVGRVLTTQDVSDLYSSWGADDRKHINKTYKDLRKSDRRRPEKFGKMPVRDQFILMLMMMHSALIAVTLREATPKHETVGQEE